MILVDVLILVMFLVVLVICSCIGIYSYIYNKFQDVIIRINEVEATIDTNLRNKYDLINRVVSIVKGNIETEEEIFEDIVKLRSRKISNFELDRKLIDANNEFQALKDKYEEINKSDEIKKISKQLKEIDEKLTTFRDYYNDNISKYNRLVRNFPTNIVALACKYKEKLFFDRKDMSDEDYEDFKL